MTEMRTKTHPALDALIKEFGPKAAVEMLGYSPNALAPSSIECGVRHCVEIAAEAIMGRPQGGQKAFLIVVGPEKVDALKNVLTLSGIAATEIDMGVEE